MKLHTLLESKNVLPTRKLGKTGHNVSLLSMGGQGSLETQKDEDKNIGIIRKAYELGINYMDTSPVYGDSELYYGKALEGIRDKIFLASKTQKRDRDGSLKLLEKSLKRLKTDYLDLWQIHHLEDIDNVNKATGADGALQAMLEMQEQGVIKFIGITGHEHPNVLMEAMNRYNFDTVLCPVNASDKNMNKSFSDTILKKANEEDMGIIGMKVFSQGYIFNPKGITTSWEPLIYSTSAPISTIIVGHDNIEQLEENISIIKNFRQLTDSEMIEIENKTKSYSREANFFRREYGGYDSKEKLDPPTR